MYEYRATILRVIDGDTIEARVDLGFDVSVIERFRLYGINAPETKGESREEGKAATEYLRVLVAKNAQDGVLTIQTLGQTREVRTLSGGADCR